MEGGSEIGAEFEQTCANLGIHILVLPQRYPKFNGRVAEHIWMNFMPFMCLKVIWSKQSGVEKMGMDL